MSRYVALLRGINVSGQKKILMKDLATYCRDIGLKQVETYVQSGNLVFSSDKKDLPMIREGIEEMIRDNYNFDVPVVVIDVSYLKSVISENPFPDQYPGEEKAFFVAFLYEKPDPDLVSLLDEVKVAGEFFSMGTNCIYMYFPNGVGKARLSNNYFERKLKTRATTRNWKTVNTLFRMADE